MKGFFDYLAEELNRYQLGIQKDWIKQNKEDGTGLPSNYHDALFKKYTGSSKATRFEIPLIAHNSVNPEIYDHLRKHGWIVHDYKKGIAVKNAPTKQDPSKIVQKSIGKVLSETGGDTLVAQQPLLKTARDASGKEIRDEHGNAKTVSESQTLSQLFANDKLRSNSSANDNLKLVVSRHPSDVMEMSTNKKWTTCTEVPKSENASAGSMYDSLKHDLNHGTLVAYLMPKHSDNVDDAVGRGLLKRYDSRKETTFRPEQTTYGNGHSMIMDSLNSFAEKEFPVKNIGDFTKHKDLYDDDNVKKLHLVNKENNKTEETVHSILSQHGLNIPMLHVSNVKINKNLNGELHGTPSLTADLGKGRTLEMSHYNGIEHNEDNKPSLIIHKGNDLLYQERKTMGNLHSTIDGKPSIIDNLTAGRSVEKWHKFGNQEINPATGFSVVEKTDSGEVHRNMKYEDFMGKPYEKKVSKGLFNTLITKMYRKKGKEPFQTVDTIDNNGNTVKQTDYFKDDKLLSHDYDLVNQKGKIHYKGGSSEEYQGKKRVL